ncbi:hypothetical protein SLEP1_g34189 [Rubroshorea leprosula]|uniref:Uncharacterized protein n=1 Tax=Rubroshorea leprosula TaxID=152421 RepID=A0AAV5KJ14_9ROSI|nr:hypothetical protein SLEP1_g34189 [Rubroshorea leprosula]
MTFLRLQQVAIKRADKHAPRLGQTSSSQLIGKRHSKSMQHTKGQARAMRKMKASMKRLRVEMKEIGEEQKSIREGQRQVREKFEAIEIECEKLRQETKLITEQSATTRFRLALMFQILKARQNNDFPRAIALTQTLRLVYLLSFFKNK